jgi:thiosulfate dehydrogenase
MMRARNERRRRKGVFVAVLLRWSALCALAVLSVASAAAGEGAGTVPFKAPAESTIPAGQDGEAIRFGKALITDTRRLLPRNVGNGLDCQSCHLGAGTTPFAGPFVGLWGVFPEYFARSGGIDSLQQRVDDCFLRSMNGKALAWNSKEMNAILMYVNWLSTGVPVGTAVAGRGMGEIDTELVPDRGRGRKIYVEKCASCHGAEGGGTEKPGGGYVFPPVWGGASFNVGAGLARTFTAAAFIKHNMPLGQGGTLSDQDAVDVAEFVAHQPRPAYPAGKNDYAKGAKPKDARN